MNSKEILSLGKKYSNYLRIKDKWGLNNLKVILILIDRIPNTVKPYHFDYFIGAYSSSLNYLKNHMFLDNIKQEITNIDANKTEENKLEDEDLYDTKIVNGVTIYSMKPSQREKPENHITTSSPYTSNTPNPDTNLTGAYITYSTFGDTAGSLKLHALRSTKVTRDERVVGQRNLSNGKTSVDIFLFPKTGTEDGIVDFNFNSYRVGTMVKGKPKIESATGHGGGVAGHEIRGRKAHILGTKYFIISTGQN